MPVAMPYLHFLNNEKAKKRLFFCFCRFFIIFAIVFYTNSSFSQKRENKSSSDSLKVKVHSPRKAAISSAIFPGAGQAYNRNYWKMPIVYMGFGALYYLSEFNNKNYLLFRDAYIYVDLKGPLVLYEGSLDKKTLQTYKQLYKRSRDLNYIMMGGLYFLNIIDATVDAHLFDYDIGKDISLHIEPMVPVIQSEFGVSQAFCLSCRINF